MAIPLTYSAISGLPAGAEFNTMTGQFNWTPNYDQAGDYTIRFGVSDPGGLSDQIDVNVHIDNVDRPPTLVVTNHGAVVGQPLTFTLLGSDPDQGTVLTYSASGHARGRDPRPAAPGRSRGRPARRRSATTPSSSRSPTAS